MIYNTKILLSSDIMSLIAGSAILTTYEELLITQTYEGVSLDELHIIQ